MNDPILTMSGNLTRKPDERVTATGRSLARFRLASTPRFLNKATGEWEDRETFFLDVVCWKPALIANVVSTLDKGSPVVVQGRLQSHTFETKDGEQRTAHELDASFVAVDLNRVQARIIKIERASTAPDEPAETVSDPWSAASRPLVADAAGVPAQVPEPVAPAA